MKTFLDCKNTFPAVVTMLVFLLALGTFQTHGQLINLPRTASPAASTMQTIGISTVKVDYSRPAVRGREVWGALVPYGWNIDGFGAQNKAPWRAGANENTVITFSHPVKVEGIAVPAGSYGLFFTINEDNSGKVVLSKDNTSWGSYWYDPANDQLRADIKIRNVAHTELLTYGFTDLTKNTAELVLNWEKKQFPVKLEFAVDEIVMANAEQQLKGAAGFTPNGYSTAANYALQNNIDLEKGLKWIDAALQANNTFTTKHIKAGLLKKMGRSAEAETLLQQAMAIANEGELNAYGYQLLQEGAHKEAVDVFLLNTERHPKSANAWDSLGEGYATLGDNKNAVKCFKKSLGLNPAPNVKANSEKFLKQLGAL